MTPRTATTDDERLAVTALQGVRMCPASWDKRFRNQLSPDALSEKERPQVWRLFKKYRRQINCPRKAELLGIAKQFSAPDFRTLNAKAEIQKRIEELKQKSHDTKTNPVIA
jgi:hypothetical protein